MAMGVYAIRCKPTGQAYVGSSIDIGKRWNGHRKALRAGIATKRLQEAWDHWGEQSFSFEVLAECPREALRVFEANLIREYRALGPGGLNMSKGLRGESRLSAGYRRREMRWYGKANTSPL